MNDSIVYNSRSESASATANGANDGYDYDSIGKRTFVQENADEITSCQANVLNKYTILSVDGIIGSSLSIQFVVFFLPGMRPYFR